MCGIHGYLGDHRVTQKMVVACRHRGPDGAEVWADERISLGHNLLSIRALPNESRQPLAVDGGVLTYNGELYGVDDERGDTQFLAEALSRNPGDEKQVLKGLNGMFALAWYRPETGRLLLARDRLGSKPLYYTYLNGRVDGHLAFSSELRGLLAAGVKPQLDPVGLRLYLRCGYVPGRHTLLKGVFKLAPGEIREYDAANGNLIGLGSTLSQAPDSVWSVDDYRQRLAESVALSLPSRRQVGLFLSGGLDSCSVLWGAIQAGTRPDTLTTRFGPDDEDANVAAQAAAYYGTKHTELPPWTRRSKPRTSRSPAKGSRPTCQLTARRRSWGGRWC